ncbi:hypothetical protein FRZ61_24110 [Hypericibacter adhaerens]|jgi:hypothetical protein|uniref:Lipoprotein n=1 Tax=Hypericibacter adhaerens TaxID=2602016 RepID=A0A5J6MY44_9PROT|nr:hypothetical protein [Hypericibacter adhaerens]QEX22479.1 hypothetical protein FRZ61_24110 [Hypericibacter adhaerens]
MRIKQAVKLAAALGIAGMVMTGCGRDDDQAQEKGQAQETSQAQTEPAQQAEQEHVEAGVAAAEADDPSRWAPSPEAIAQARKDADAPPIEMADDGSSDIALGGMERPPVPPAPPRLLEGDDADQYGLAAWEQIARGDLKPRRIHY